MTTKIAYPIVKSLATGGVVGGVSGGLQGRALRNKVLEGQIQNGEKTIPSGTFKSEASRIAKQQGFDDTDIQFVQSMKPQDKIKAQKMVERCLCNILIWRFS